MSRIGQKSIIIPQGAQVNLEKDLITVSGIKGSLSWKINPAIQASLKENEIFLTRKNDDGKIKAIHGTTRQVISNMVKGVTEGWSKNLEIQGTGFRVTLNGNVLTFSLGFSHPVVYPAKAGISFLVAENKITVLGVDKVLVGQEAANIRAIKPPDPYKGKGIRYANEIIKLKPGKQAKVGAVGAGGAKPAGK